MAATLDGGLTLDGILVVDLTHVLAGPFATMHLAQMGARVIKVEQPGRGDEARGFAPFRDGESLYFASVNAGKESIALDLRVAADRLVFEGLLARADVLAENFRPGTLAGLGYQWPELHHRYPRLIYGSITGFGSEGPDADRAAYDIVLQAMGGLMSMLGPAGSAPIRSPMQIADLTAGLYLAHGIVAALYQRERTKQGSRVDISMLDCQAAFMCTHLTTALATGALPERTATRHPWIAPYEAFAASDGWLIVGAPNDQLFARLCEVIEQSQLADAPLFRTNELRVKHRDELAALIGVVLRGRPLGEWILRLDAHGVPCAPVQSVMELARNNSIVHRAMLRKLPTPAGPLHVVGSPLGAGAGFCGESAAPPGLDRDRAAILALAAAAG